MLARRTRVLTASSALALTIALFVSAGCSKDKTTNPPVTTKELLSATLVAGDGTAPNAQFVHTFNTAGTFPYHCSIHPAMTASISVAAGGADSLNVDIVNQTSTGFQPGTGTVKVGGIVHWRNKSGQPHTVTSD